MYGKWLLSGIPMVSALLFVIAGCTGNKDKTPFFPWATEISLFVSADTGYSVVSSDSIVVSKTADKGKTWTKATVNINANAFATKLLAFGDSLLLLAKNRDTSYTRDSAYLVTSYDGGKNWKCIFKTGHMQDALFSSASSGLIMVDDTGPIGKNHLITYANGSFADTQTVELMCFYKGILSMNKVYAFIETDTNANELTGVRIIDINSGKETSFTWGKPYYILNPQPIRENGCIYIRAYAARTDKAAILRISNDGAEVLDLAKLDNADIYSLVVSGNMLCINSYDSVAKKYALLISKDSGENWHTDTSFSWPLAVVAPSIYNNTLYAFDTNGVQCINLR